jgi:predicted ABC-type ATPase
MFAGPNGSGKSTLQDVVHPSLLGYYLNPDDIGRALGSSDGFDLAGLPFEVSLPELRESLRQFPHSSELDEHSYVVRETRLFVNSGEGIGYRAAGLADLLRRKLLISGETFSFETVMSHASKIDLLKDAQDRGYRTYLYYISTGDPQINVSRVQSRVQSGGHSVPENKIVTRYERSMSLLPEAIRHSSRAYVFDNSAKDEERVWIAEFEGPTDMTLKVEPYDVPKWFEEYVLSRMV